MELYGPISGRPTLMPFFTVWQFHLHPNSKWVLNTLSSQDTGLLLLVCPSSWVPLGRNEKGGGWKKEKTRLLEIPKCGNPKGWDLPLGVSNHREAFNCGRAGDGTSVPDRGCPHSSLSQVQSRQVSWCGGRRPSEPCRMLCCSPQPAWQGDLLGGSFHQSCYWKVNFRTTQDSELKSMSEPQSWGPWGVYLNPCW